MRKQFGMTLIEILIVLAIIAGLAAFAAATVGGGGNQVRKVAFEIVRNVRYLYDTTLIQHKNHRLVFDLTEQKIYAEVSENPYYIRKENSEEKREETETQDEDEDIEDEDSTFMEDDKQITLDTIEPPAEAEFVAIDDDVLGAYPLPKNARLMDVFIDHQEKAIEEGVAYLYFFPKGYTEFAVIHVGNEEGEKAMTLIINPLSGAVEVREGYVEKEEIEE